MIKLQSLIKIAIEEAIKSDHKHKHGCIIYDKNKVISRGHNSVIRHSSKLHPKFKGPYCCGVHAEAAAILAAKTDLKDCDSVVIRINKKKQLLNSKPCKHCLLYLKYVGIKKITYSINAYPYFEEIKL